MQQITFDQLELNPFEVMSEDNFLLTSGTKEDFNTMTCGWGALGYIWAKPSITVFVRESRYTLEFMDKNDIFTASFFPPIERSKLFYCGTHSGRDVNKIKECGLNPIALDGGIAFEEANLVFVCKKISKTFIDKDSFIDQGILTHYPQGDFHYMFVGEIKGIYIN